MPELIQFKNGNQIRNLYDATGKKLQASYYTRLSTLPVPLADGEVATDVSSTNLYLLNGTDYVGDFEYVFSNDGGDYQHDLDKIYNDEGYVQGLANPQYYYFRHDHLGDNREVWCGNTNTVVQRTQYYPSGLPWIYQTGDNPDLQHRKYNGKEFVEMHGYDTYDIVWRQYNPATMRFQTQDPFAEKYYNLSPYTMCSDNMVRYTDPDGRNPVLVLTLEEAAGASGSTGIGVPVAIGIQVVVAAVLIYDGYKAYKAYKAYSANNTNNANTSQTQTKANTNTSQTQAKAKTNSAQTTAAAPAPKKPDDKKKDTSQKNESKRRFSKKDRDAGFEKSKDSNGTARCKYCNCELEKKAGSGNSYEADHATSYKNGGTSTQDNLNASCRDCNREKGSLNANEYKSTK